MGYHYRVAVPTGYAEEIREAIEPPDAIAAQVDGSNIHLGNDVTLLTVFSGDLESLDGLKAWVNAHPEVPDVTVLTMIGTPLSVRELELESLRSTVRAHQTLEVEEPARGTMGP